MEELEKQIKNSGKPPQGVEELGYVSSHVHASLIVQWNLFNTKMLCELLVNFLRIHSEDITIAISVMYMPIKTTQDD